MLQSDMSSATEIGTIQRATSLPAAMLATVLGSADTGPGLVMFSPSRQFLFGNLQATRLMRELRQLEPRHRRFDGIPQAISRCCQDLAESLNRHPNPRSWGRVQLIRVLGGEGNMILARFHAVPAATEPAQISMIVGLLELISVGQRSTEMLTLANFRFTEREQACVTHLIQGMTDKEIARHLGLSEYTVKDHFKHVRKKTDATNRSGIIARVLGRAQAPRNGASVVKASYPLERSIR